MQNKINISSSLKISLHGMNKKMQKIMANYLEISCKGLAHVVGENEAHAEIIDVDLAHSKYLLTERLSQQPSKPIIALSTQKISIENVIYVKKPIETPNVINALKTAKTNLLSNKELSSEESSRQNNNRSPARKRARLAKSSENKKITKTKQATNSLDSNRSISTKSLDSKPHSVSKPTNTAVFSERELSGRQQIKNNEVRTSIHPTSTSKPEKSPNNIKNRIKKNKATERNNSKPFSNYIIEIDKLLKELQNPFKKSKKKINISKNNRKTVRYAFEPIEGKLNKKYFTKNIDFKVLILDISSRGALIELQKPTKLRRKVTLKIQLDTQKPFRCLAHIVRNEGENRYGLQFLKNQHELIDNLIDSGHSFFYS